MTPASTALVLAGIGKRFGDKTVLDGLSFTVPRGELSDYGDTIRAPEWKPFVWPKTWEKMPAFPDSKFGLRALQSYGYYTVALSNAPLALAMRMIANADLAFNAIIPLETIKTYKPNPAWPNN